MVDTQNEGMDPRPAQGPTHKSLARFCCTDGSSIFLARTFDEHGQKQRLGLGKHVWRFSNGKDGLYDDNVGPSLYAKAQGKPVKFWGLLANGMLHLYVLPMESATKTTHMNGVRYRNLVKKKFATWRRASFDDDGPAYLVQDHERCLWQDASLAELRKAGFTVEDFPKSSADLNAIEGVWRLLKERLSDTEPEEFESRADFLVRLRRAVAWLNSNRAEHMLYLCTNQKERAQDVLDLLGAKTKW